MAKEVKAAEPAGDQATVGAIKKSKFDTLLKICMASQNVMADQRTTIFDKIKTAVTNDSLDRTAFSWIRKLARMDEAKRNGVLFNFHVYCGYREWPSDGLPLGDREETDAESESEPAGETEHDNGAERLRELKSTDETDLRPRHLRSGSADPDPNIKH